MKTKIVKGKVSHSWTWIFGRYKIGKNKVQTGNFVRGIILKNSKWAKVEIYEDGEIKQLMDCR